MHQRFILQGRYLSLSLSSFIIRRHWGCVTPTILSKVGASFNITGFDDLPAEQQEKVEKAFEKGFVDREDVSMPEMITQVLPESEWTTEEKKAKEEAMAAKREEQRLAREERKKASQAALAEANGETVPLSTNNNEEPKINTVVSPTTNDKTVKDEEANDVNEEINKKKPGNKRKKAASASEDVESPKKATGKKVKAKGDVEQVEDEDPLVDEVPAKTTGRGRKAKK